VEQLTTQIKTLKEEISLSEIEQKKLTDDIAVSKNQMESLRIGVKEWEDKFGKKADELRTCFLSRDDSLMQMKECESQLTFLGEQIVEAEDKYDACLASKSSQKGPPPVLVQPTTTGARVPGRKSTTGTTGTEPLKQPTKIPATSGAQKVIATSGRSLTDTVNAKITGSSGKSLDTVTKPTGTQYTPQVFTPELDVQEADKELEVTGEAEAETESEGEGKEAESEAEGEGKESEGEAKEAEGEAEGDAKEEAEPEPIPAVTPPKLQTTSTKSPHKSSQ